MRTSGTGSHSAETATSSLEASTELPRLQRSITAMADLLLTRSESATTPQTSISSLTGAAPR